MDAPECAARAAGLSGWLTRGRPGGVRSTGLIGIAEIGTRDSGHDGCSWN
jgi:hypothetical protein